MIEKYKEGIYPSGLYLSKIISLLACAQKAACKTGLFVSSPWGQGFSRKDNTFSAVLVKGGCPCLSPLPHWKNLLFYQGLLLHFLWQVTWQCEKLGYYPSHSSLMFPWDTYPLDPSATFPTRVFFRGRRVKRKRGWNLSSHRQSLWSALFMGHIYFLADLASFAHLYVH